VTVDAAMQDRKRPVLVLPDDAPYVPGLTERPLSGLFMEIAERAPERTDPAAWRDNEAWLHGFSLYAAGYFWEAHEVWEPVWMGTTPNSAERHLAQGLIQIANACLKLAMNRPKAALRLARDARQRLQEAAGAGQDSLMGVEMAPLIRETHHFIAALSAADVAAPQLLSTRPKMFCAA